jgi:hypothetical protein
LEQAIYGDAVVFVLIALFVGLRAKLATGQPLEQCQLLAAVQASHIGVIGFLG